MQKLLFAALFIAAQIAMPISGPAVTWAASKSTKAACVSKAKKTQSASKLACKKLKAKLRPTCIAKATSKYTKTVKGCK